LQSLELIKHVEQKNCGINTRRWKKLPILTRLKYCRPSSSIGFAKSIFNLPPVMVMVILAGHFGKGIC